MTDRVEELKPCPFCGGRARFECNLHGWSVLCGEGLGECQVDVQTKYFTTAKSALAAWNTRQPYRFNKGLGRAMNAAPDGDLRIDVELVTGGWVGYVWLTPIHGPIVPAGAKSIHLRTNTKPTRAEAIEALPEVIEAIRAMKEPE